MVYQSRGNKKGILLITLLATLLTLTTLVAGNDITTLEANIVDSGTSGSNETGSISLQVPDFIDLEEVDEDGNSEELKIYINNTGDVAITVTPQLIGYSDDIFSNLYFREFKTSGGSPVTPQRIGSWSFNISAPTGGSEFRSKYFYMQLDLSDANIDLSSDLIGHRADVRFVATAQ